MLSLRGARRSSLSLRSTLNADTVVSVARRNAAADALLAAETLIEQFRRVAPDLRSPMPADVTAAIGQLQHIYPGIWSHLDLARSLLGTEVGAYDALRARQPEALMGVTSIKTADPIDQMAIFMLAGAAIASVDAKSASSNRAGIVDAQEALELLRSALPDVDWKSLRIENARATDDLGRATLGSRFRSLLVAAGVVAGIVAIVIVIAKLLSPPGETKTRNASTPAMSAARLDELRTRLQTDPCDARAAELLVMGLRSRGRVGESKQFGEDFIGRCGDNADIRRRIGPK